MGVGAEPRGASTLAALLPRPTPRAGGGKLYQIAGGGGKVRVGVWAEVAPPTPARRRHDRPRDRATAPRDATAADAMRGRAPKSGVAAGRGVYGRSTFAPGAVRSGAGRREDGRAEAGRAPSKDGVRGREPAPSRWVWRRPRAAAPEEAARPNRPVRVGVRRGAVPPAARRGGGAAPAHLCVVPRPSRGGAGARTPPSPLAPTSGERGAPPFARLYSPARRRDERAGRARRPERPGVRKAAAGVSPHGRRTPRCRGGARARRERRHLWTNRRHPAAPPKRPCLALRPTWVGEGGSAGQRRTAPDDRGRVTRAAPRLAFCPPPSAPSACCFAQTPHPPPPWSVARLLTPHTERHPSRTCMRPRLAHRQMGGESRRCPRHRSR